ncbi:MAG TPA: hypothetical protein VGD90_02710 [Sphingobacteriaceae bacterium]
MKVIVIYYSYTGNNEALAKELQRRLACSIWKIEEVHRRRGITIFLDILFRRKPKIRKPAIQLSRFHYVILVAPVWAGKIAGPLKTFLELEAGQISKYSFITLCGGAGNTHLSTELENLLQKKPLLITELSVNKLLAPEKRDKVKYTSGYRLQEGDLKVFDAEIKGFMQSVVGEVSLQT